VTYLTTESNDQDSDEQRIRYKSSEYVVFTVDLPGADFIAESHHDKGVEYDSEMLSWSSNCFGTHPTIDVE
jgi:hypothetical protein